MRNRAKCKKCESIIESYHRHDYVTCKCGEISVDGGNDYLKCSAIDFANFLRVDDEGNEIIVSVKESDDILAAKPQPGGISDIEKPTRKEMIEMLANMIHSIERLPAHAIDAPITHADHASLMILLLSIFRSE